MFRQLSTFGTANILAVWYFKKINEILKRVPSNKKLSIFYFSLFYHSLISYSELETNTRNSDQLDSTILIQAGRSSNLIIALQSSNLPPILSQLASLYTQKKKFFQERKPSISRTTLTFLSMFKRKNVNLTGGKSLFQVFQKLSTYIGLAYTNHFDTGSSMIEYGLCQNGNIRHFFGKIICMFQIAMYKPKYRRNINHKLYTFICVQQITNLSPLNQKKGFNYCVRAN
ncbi:uncharacterized protein VP01_1111g2 [Puccinia sorghi]|uniref:Uncharacterized protein n=1 Tax=Puccinia sorghi TaxID=27349 RepID=A0A0L6VSL2_9BASI|nr:uncharacterized protein VP01_1111g2 [Puccinia sorghi]